MMRFSGMFWRSRLACAALSLVAVGTIFAAPAQSEVSEIRFGRQLGLGYLQLYIAQELRLVEKHAVAAGLPAPKVTYVPLGSPAAINDAFLSGSIEFGGAGVPPFLILWDKTRTSYRVKALTALNSQPAFLNTVDPTIHSINDFADGHRIALPAVKSSFQAIVLQMAAEQAFGPGQHGRLDRLTVSISHPDGTAAMLSGRSEITSHFTSAPFQYQQLRDTRIRRVLSSYDITGAATTFSVLWTGESFHRANPLTIRAVVRAMEEATQFISANRAEAARIFIKLDNSKLPQEFVEALLADPDIGYAVTPQNVLKLSDFMSRTGSIAARPTAWQELFFGDLHERAGS